MKIVTSLSFPGTCRDEARRIFEGLSEGGAIRMPFAESPWSPGFGGFTDKFGVPWMINTNPDMPA